MTFRSLLSLPLLLFAFVLPGHGGEHDAVVLVGGCSGVCVDPAGIVLTAKHCDHGETATVRFREHPPVEAVRVYVGHDAEDVVAFDCRGDGWPSVAVAEEVAETGSRVSSAGYPAVRGERPLRTANGKLLGGGEFTFVRNGTPVGNFLANTTDFRTGPGWSGGPLFDGDGEVIGILSAGNATESTFLSHRATRRAYVSARFDLRQVGDATVRRPHVLLFGFDGCQHCARAWGDITAGRFGRVLRVNGDEVETERYVIEYIHVDTKEGAERYRKLVAALEKATGKEQPTGAFPAWHVAGRAAITTGYPRQEGFRRLGKWFVETLRLPVTIFEGVTTPEDPGISLLPMPEPGPDVSLGETSPLPTETPSSAGDPAPGLVETVINRVTDRVEDLVRQRIDDRFGDDTLVGSVADVAVDRVEARIDERLGRERDKAPPPWGGGLLGSALASLELWFRRKEVTA